jgi:tetratricopeptide (TPR) repeat protein
MAAGQHALRASAASDASAHFRMALRLLGDGPEPSTRAEALIGLGDALTLAGDYAAALEALRGACTLNLRAGAPAGAGAAFSRLGKVLWRQEDLEAAHQAFGRALELLGSEDSSDVAATLLQVANLEVTSLGQNASALEHVTRALRIVEHTGDRQLQSSACCVLGNIKARGNDLEEGRDWLERALALAREVDDPTLGAEACGHLANLYAWTGDLEKSREISVLRAEFAQRTHDLFQLRHVYSSMGVCLVLQAKWAEAQEWFAREQEIVDALDTPEPRADSLLTWAMLHCYTGHFQDAERALHEAVTLLRPVAPATLIWHLGWLAQTLTMLGRDTEAIDASRELEVLVEHVDQHARARGNALAQCAVAYALQGSIDRAAACYAALSPFQGQFSPVLIDRGLALPASVTPAAMTTTSAVTRSGSRTTSIAGATSAKASVKSLTRPRSRLIPGRSARPTSWIRAAGVSVRSWRISVTMARPMSPLAPMTATSAPSMVRRARMALTSVTRQREKGPA